MEDFLSFILVVNTQVQKEDRKKARIINWSDTYADISWVMNKLTCIPIKRNCRESLGIK